MHSKLALPQAAWLIIFIVKSVVLHLQEEPELSTNYREDREEKKSPAPSRIQTHELSVMRHALYRLATPAAPVITRDESSSKNQNKIVERVCLQISFDRLNSNMHWEGSPGCPNYKK